MTRRQKGFTIAMLILPVILMTGCCRMSDTVRPIAEKVFKEAALTEPLPPTAFTSDGCSLWFDGDWVECCVHTTWTTGGAEPAKRGKKRIGHWNSA